MAVTCEVGPAPNVFALRRSMRHAGVNYHEGAEFVRASLARDQDVVVDFKALQQVLIMPAPVSFRQ